MSSDLMADIAETAKAVRGLPDYLRTQSSVARAVRDAASDGSVTVVSRGTSSASPQQPGTALTVCLCCSAPPSRLLAPYQSAWESALSRD